MPEPPAKSPEVNETEDIKLVLPVEDSVVEVTLRWKPPEVTGGNLTEFIILLVAVGDSTAGEGRRKRQTNTFLQDCIRDDTGDNNFTVPAKQTTLDINASKESLLR